GWSGRWNGGSATPGARRNWRRDRRGVLRRKIGPTIEDGAPSLFFMRRFAMALTAAQIEQQKQQAEELLFSEPQALGFAEGLFFGHFNAPLLFPYPALRPEERA